MASPLVEAHIEAQRRLRELVSRAVRGLWVGLPGYDERDVPVWLAGVVPVVLAGQRQSVALTEAYIARSLQRAPLGVNPDDLTGAAARNGTSPQEVYRRPFVTVWTALKAGTAYEEAVNAGLARATGSAAMDVQLSSRATFTVVQQADDAIQGWQRVADGGACAFCLTIDGAFVKSADASPLHNHCGCSLEPVTEPVRSTPVPEGVAVHAHGELGAVLTDPAHDFTSEAQVLG